MAEAQKQKPVASPSTSNDLTKISGSVFIATDGAGKVKTRAWTVNIDPEGHISAEEAEATLEAVEATSPVNPIG